MTPRERLKNEAAFVEARLGGDSICSRCGANLITYGEVCPAEISDTCPGFVAIENAIAEFNKAVLQ